MSPAETPPSASPERAPRRRVGASGPSEAAARPREPLDVAPIDPPAPFPLVEVRNPGHGTRYRVAIPEFPERQGALCSCEDFSRRGKGTCKHIEAAWVALRAQAPTRLPPPGPGWVGAVWAEIDRRQGLLTAGTPPGPRELRAAGRAVIEAPEPYAVPPAGRAGRSD